MVWDNNSKKPKELEKGADRIIVDMSQFIIFH